MKSFKVQYPFIRQAREMAQVQLIVSHSVCGLSCHEGRGENEDFPTQCPIVVKDPLQARERICCYRLELCQALLI